MSAQPSVDWETAGVWAGQLTPAGPTPSRTEATDLVADLRQAAHRARDLALEASGLADALAAPGAIREPAQVLVVDRAGWARAAAASFTAIAAGPLPGTTGQAASVLALLATRVLGQFDPYTPGPAGGRLLLVAPNVLRTERGMRVVPGDFRLWVCAHEQTHALQFAAAPWLAGHIRSEVDGLLQEVTSTSSGSELAAMLAGLGRAVRPATRQGWSVLDVLPKSQRVRVERVTAVMSLLEGHADVTMDAVGPRAIPTAATLRKRMEAKRSSTAPTDLLLRRLLALDVKLAQYRDGASFVRAVRAAGGPDALDAVWSGPEALPAPAEIADAAAWLRRVHGPGR